MSQALDRQRHKDLQYLHWIMAAAQTFSTCSRAQHFAVILDEQGHVLGTGYNGGAKDTPHCVDGGCPRGRGETMPGADYDNCIGIHAEVNALLHSDYSARREGCTMYVTGTPCYGCAKAISNGSVTRLVCVDNGRYADWERVRAYLEGCKVHVTTYETGEVGDDASNCNV